MPDISKLEQLCNVLHITTDELLGSNDRQTRTVSKILRDEELPEAEEVAEIAPIVPAEKIIQAARETAKKRQVNWDAIVNMAPFLDAQTLDEILENAEPGDYGVLASLAPFLSTATLDRLVSGCEGKVDRELLASLAPFLCKATLEKLMFQCEGEVDMDMEMVDHLAPFLSTAALDKLVEKLLKKGNTADLSHLYPFLGRETMRKLVKKMMDNGDFDSMRDAAVFL